MDLGLGIPYGTQEVVNGQLIVTCPACGEKFTERTDRVGELKTDRYGDHYVKEHQS